MKTISLQKTLFKAILALALFSGIEANAQGTVTFSKPGNSMDYTHNGTTWVHESNSTYTYNSSGDLTLHLFASPTTNQNLGKQEITYDARGSLSKTLNYQWQNNAWVFTGGQKDSMVYNASNQVVTHFSSISQGGSWTSFKTDNTYNASGELTGELSYSLDNGTWTSTEKKTISYTNGIITEKLLEHWNGTTWVNSLKENYLTWLIPNVEPALYTTQMFNTFTNQWNCANKYTFTPTSNGGYIKLTERFQNNTWENYHRYTLANDSRGNTINELYERFINGAWVNLGENQTLITYNSLFDITEQTWRWPMPPVGQVAGPPVDQYKEVYSNFQYFTRVLGASEMQNTELASNVYPNPATDKIQIELTDKKPQSVTATVSDVTGKTWQTKTFKAGESKQLNIEALPKGIYLLQLQTEAGSTVKRIVKQ